MTRPQLALLIVTLASTLYGCATWAQAEAPQVDTGATEAEAVGQDQDPLSQEILDAKKIFILNTVMDFSLFNAFSSEIMDWERFEVVFSEDEADLCFALSAQSDYRKEEIPTGGPDDGEMRPRPVGTMRTLDKLYLKIFVPGGEDLWRDEADVGDDSEAAVELVRRLRERIEQAEAEGSAADTGR